MNVLELFYGGGGGYLAHELLGHRTIAAVELHRYCGEVLEQRIRDQHVRDLLFWRDIRTFDALHCPWFPLLRGLVDIVSGGFPCQGFSSAGKGAGLSDARSELWFDMVHVVRSLRPHWYGWRTAHGSRGKDSGEFVQIFSRWGIVAYGRYWALDTSALRTTVTGSGSLPTPTTQGNEFAPSMTKWKRHRQLQQETFPTWGINQSEHLGGHPNPDWRDWLMGWPIGWSACKPLAMDRFQQWARAHSAFSTGS